MLKSIKNNGVAVTLATLMMVPAFVSAQTNTTPVITPTSTSGLIVSMTSPVSMINGGTNVNLATIRLDATGLSGISVYSLPINAGYMGGITADNLNNCRVFNMSTGASLTNGNNVYTALFNGSNTIRFDTPLVVNPGTPAMLSFNCDVTAPTGSSISLTVAPGSFQTGSVTTSNGTAVYPTAGVTSSGTAAPTTGTVMFTGVGGVVTTPTVPTVPNTGFGGNAAYAYYALGALIVLMGTGVLLRKTSVLK